jgi:uncharacterized protein involved in response to NO
MNRLLQPIDPYRVLFPLGILLGIVGVLLWPLFVYGVWPGYPAVAHARIMTAGFAACFVLGFMGTALPHMLETRGMTRIEVWIWATGLMLASGFYFMDRIAPGDAVFLLVLATFAGCAMRRWPHRKDLPPPGFVGAVLGLLCAAVGVAMQLADTAFEFPGFVHLFSKLLFYQGFLLLPVMGIGAFILPVFMGYQKKGHAWRPPVSHGMNAGAPDADSRVVNPPSAWWKETILIFGVSLALIGSFTVEAAGHIRAAYIVRIVVLILYFARYLPVHRRQSIRGTLSWNMRLALLFILFGYALAAAWSAYYMAWLHVVFMTGFGLLIFAVASRVIIAHGGHQSLFTARWPTLWVVFGLIALAMATRVSADWMAASRFSHYAYAAMCWIPAAILWGARMFRYILDEE